MREHLAAFGQSVSARIAPLAARIGPLAARLQSGAVKAASVSARAARTGFRNSRIALDRTLSLIERALLSPRWRERLHAGSVFALIFAFGVASVDLLVTGGPELISSARAATAQSPRVDLIAATTGGGADMQLAMLEAPSAPTIAPEERPPEITPSVVRPVAVPLAELPALVDAPSEAIKAGSEARPAAEARIKDEA